MNPDEACGGAPIPIEDRVADLEGKLDALVQYFNKVFNGEPKIRFVKQPKDTWTCEPD
jgi:hypothetical protein